MTIESAIASLNDNQDLNDRDVVNFLSKLFEEKPPEEVEVEILKDYLKIQKLDDDSPYTSVAESVLEDLSKSNLQFYEEYIRDLEKEGVKYIPFYSEYYPERLRKIPNPPLALYIDGDVTALENGVAVVGTRSAHDHRLDFVRKIAHKLVEMDKVVVSGLANGVDEVAHEAALEAGGETVAILPGHVKKIRPSSNSDLGKEIKRNGALVGEISKQRSIHRGRFVERNRITSGISSAVVIGASGETGGTIHQADFAKDQSRPRFLYTPKKEDGQSPKKLFGKGFLPFETTEQLEELLNEPFEEGESDSNSTTLSDFE